MAASTGGQIWPLPVPDILVRLQPLEPIGTFVTPAVLGSALVADIFVRLGGAACQPACKFACARGRAQAEIRPTY